jgi:regulator of protease activity HflC (stomatin/prohibitin superfamily)
MSLVVGLGVAFLLLALILARAIVVVPAEHAFVVERFGRVARTLGPGLHLLAPLLDRVRARLSLGEVSRPLPTATCITLDNRVLDVDGVVRLRIVDAATAITAVADHEAATAQAAGTVLREEVATVTYDDARESSRWLSARVTERTAAIAVPWGVQVTGCDLSIKR